METFANQIIKIEIDNTAIEEQVKNALKKQIDECQNKLFYDMKDLQHVTSFSEGHIKNTFFYDPRFEKIRKKVGKNMFSPSKRRINFF